jgi:hypothetical protein
MHQTGNVHVHQSRFIPRSTFLQILNCPSINLLDTMAITLQSNRRRIDYSLDLSPSNTHSISLVDPNNDRPITCQKKTHCSKIICWTKITVDVFMFWEGYIHVFAIRLCHISKRGSLCGWTERLQWRYIIYSEEI